MAGLLHATIPATTERRGTLVFLHGLGDDMRGWSFLPDALRHPWLETILVQAPIPYGPGGWSWYELDPSLRPTPRTETDIAESRSKVADFLRGLSLPGERLMLGGFSQGCVLTLETGLREDVPLAGMLCISGYVPLLDRYPAAFGPLARTRRILSTHGHWDQVIPKGLAQEQMAALAGKGAPITLELYDKGHDLDLAEELPRIREWVEESFPA